MIVIILFSIVGVLPRVDAAIYCVTDETELLDALSEAKNNGENDQIHVQAGNYNNGTNGFSFNSAENYDLEISGGWLRVGNFPCLIQNSSPYLTVFDGNSVGPNLRFNMNFKGGLKIQNLSLINGAGISPNRGVGLLIDGGGANGKNTLIEEVVFSNNNTTFCAALCFIGSSQLTVRNNVFVDNFATSSTGVINIINYETGVYFINNTILGNETGTPGASEPISGMQIIVSDDAPAAVINNIFWDNMSGDFKVLAEDPVASVIYVYQNNYNVGYGDFDFVSGNLTADPQLTGAGLFNFVPSLSSPMKNAGLMMTAIPPVPDFFDLWDHGTRDLIGGSRVKGNGIDIGARESDPELPIFKNGFD